MSIYSKDDPRMIQPFLYGADAFSQIDMNAMVALVRGDEPDGWKKRCAASLQAVVAEIAPSGGARERAKAIYQWVVAHSEYVRDPVDYEKLQQPCAVLHDITSGGPFARLDCDDYAIFLATLMRIAGLRVRFRAVSNGLEGARPVPELDHIFAEVYLGTAAGTPDGWLPADPVAPGKDWTGHRYAIQPIDKEGITAVVSGLFERLFR